VVKTKNIFFSFCFTSIRRNGSFFKGDLGSKTS